MATDSRACGPGGRGRRCGERLQRDWEVIRYQTPARAREAVRGACRQGPQGQRGASGSRRAAYLGRHHRELLGWRERRARGARAGQAGQGLYEEAIRIDGNALDGSAFNSLGVLYYKVPGWPIGFGDKAKAKELLRRPSRSTRGASTRTSSTPSTSSRRSSRKRRRHTSSVHCTRRPARSADRRRRPARGSALVVAKIQGK